MKVYIERTVSPPLPADQVRDKSRVGEVVYGAPFRVFDLLDNGLMTWATAEQFGRVWFAEHGQHQLERDQVEADCLTVRFRDVNEDVLDLALTGLTA